MSRAEAFHRIGPHARYNVGLIGHSAGRKMAGDTNIAEVLQGGHYWPRVAEAHGSDGSMDMDQSAEIDRSPHSP